MSRATRGAALRPIYHLFETGTLIGSSDGQLLERFVAGRDEAAFEALVARHGRSVMVVCRDVLRDQHDAEDAFQATFLILARKAGSLWVGDSLSAWLHRVARRVAVEANRQKVRRRAVEKTGLEIDETRTEVPNPWGIQPQTLHDEIDRLPEKYRVPIILCDLEALTRDEAACRLGWPPGTVAGRLARARALLRDRLVRSGHVEVVGLIAMARARRVAHGDVPFSWIRKAAHLLGSSPGGAMKVSGLASVGGSVLARGVIRAMMLAKLKNIAVLSIAAALAPAVVAWAVASSRLEMLPGEAPVVRAIALQEAAKAEPAQGASGTMPAKVPVVGAIVLHDGTPAGGVRVFFSTRDHAYSKGEVRAEAGADAQGRFSLEIAPVENVSAGWPGTGVLWAYRPGSSIASISVYRGALPPGLPQRLVVGPPARAMFEVRCPDGKPAVGAQIEPRMLCRDYGLVPDGLAPIIGADTVTDAHGRAVMTAFFPEEIASIRVNAEGYGQQEFGFGYEELTPDPRVITLRPVGRLKGRLVGEPGAIRRRPLSVSTFTPPDARVPHVYSLDITTDDDGRFDIPATAIGPHDVKTIPHCDSPWYANSEGLPNVEPGQTTEVVLPLKRAIRVRGVVREKGTGKPIEGVRVAVTMAETGAMTTGPDGRYEGFVPPEVTFLIPRAVPAGYAMPMFNLPQFRVPEGAVDMEMPPLELVRTGEVRGLVVGDGARPVAGAEVEVSWDSDEGRHAGVPHRRTVRTGPDGRFVVDRVPEGAEVTLSAHHRAFRTPEPRLARVGEASILRLAPSDVAALEGRVLDPAGRPVAGANVHLRSPRRNTPYGPIVGSDLVAFEGGYVLVTDASGRFRTPKELNPDGEYAAFASAAGLRSYRTMWVRGRGRSLPDLVLPAETEAPAK